MKYRSSLQGFTVLSSVYCHMTVSKVRKLLINARLIAAEKAQTQRASLDLELLIFCNFRRAVKLVFSVVFFYAARLAKSSSDSMNRPIIRKNTNKRPSCWTVEQDN